MIDLRSDTVTQPTQAMREAMYRAQVGDDVMGEDPTINRLEKMAAQRTGKPAALFIPSGTMGNLAAFLAHCQRGDEVLLGNIAHSYLYEAGGMAALGGIHPRALPNQPDGTLRLDHIQAAIRPDDPHHPHSRLITLENSHNHCGGVAIPPDYFAAVREIADQHGLKVHLDGARIFNAAVALDIDVRALTQYVDSVTFCLSKGLSAPVGALLCGEKDFIYRARRARKMLGGGMRQAGVLAAAGIVAMEQMIDRLAEDHLRARRLAQGINAMPQLTINMERVQTNILFFDLVNDHPTPQQVVDYLREHQVQLNYYPGEGFRAVTHCWIDDQDIETALAALKEAVTLAAS